MDIWRIKNWWTRRGSRLVPHASKREAERRVRQMERGSLRESNGAPDAWILRQRWQTEA